MNEYGIIAIVAGFVLLNIAFYFVMVWVASGMIYNQTLSRQSKEQWSRTAPIEDPRQQVMQEIGNQWADKYADCKKDVHIVRDGLNLYGEYYDLGYDKAVMIISGRTECSRYGYYFAIPYAEAGLNVLVVDPRAHGLSDGKYNTLGFEESKDAIAWCKLLHDAFGVKDIVLHGICIGAAGGMFAITAPECPDYIRALVTEGMFARFAISMKQHMIERKRHLWPVLQWVDLRMKRATGHSMMKGPINVIDKMDKPLLMLHSEEDHYSLPQYAQLLYDSCPSKNKELVWFETGDHSMLRHTHTEKYDASIKAFLRKIFQPEKD